MIIRLNADGSLINPTDVNGNIIYGQGLEPVFQGSSGIYKVQLEAPFLITDIVEISFKLPDRNDSGGTRQMQLISSYAGINTYETTLGQYETSVAGTLEMNIQAKEIKGYSDTGLPLYTLKRTAKVKVLVRETLDINTGVLEGTIADSILGDIVDLQAEQIEQNNRLTDLENVTQVDIPARFEAIEEELPRIENIALDAKATAEDVERRANAGEFDGTSIKPEVWYSTIEEMEADFENQTVGTIAGISTEEQKLEDNGKVFVRNESEWSFLIDISVAGVQGFSAYEIAVRYDGFIGTEVAWLASLVGPQGPAGTDGKDGANGTNGVDGKDGTIIIVDGEEQTLLEFTSDPQTQINNLDDKIDANNKNLIIQEQGTVYLNTGGVFAETEPTSTVQMSISLIGTNLSFVQTIPFNATEVGLVSTLSNYAFDAFFTSVVQNTVYTLHNLNWHIGTTLIATLSSFKFSTGNSQTEWYGQIPIVANILTTNIQYEIGQEFTLTYQMSKSSGGNDAVYLESRPTVPTAFIRNGGQINSSNVYDFNGTNIATQAQRNREYEASSGGLTRTVVSLTNAKIGQSLPQELIEAYQLKKFIQLQASFEPVAGPIGPNYDYMTHTGPAACAFSNYNSLKSVGILIDDESFPLSNKNFVIQMRWNTSFVFTGLELLVSGGNYIELSSYEWYKIEFQIWG